MTMATGWYGLTFEKLLEAASRPDLDSDTIKDLLVTNTYTPNFETDDFQNDTNVNEITGTGYTAGGVTLASVTSGIATGVYTFDSADKSWTTATFTARGDVHYDSTPGSAATNYALWGRTFGADVPVSAGTFTIQENASGIWTVAYR